MKKQDIGVFCPLCKERFYKKGLASDKEIDKINRTKVHEVEELPKYCTRCGGRLRLIKKYVLSSSNKEK